MEETIPLESKGVRVLTKCNKRQIGIVATQTNLKMDKGLVSTSVYSRGLMRSNGVIPTSIIQTSLKIKLSAPRAANKQWQQRGP